MLRTFVVIVALCNVALADSAIDEVLYNCKKRTADVQINFKPEIELKELLTWVVGFTCKKVVYDPRIISAGRKVTMMVPGTQTAADAYRMFEAALSTIGYTIVRKGDLLRVVEAATARGDSVPIYDKGVPDGDRVVRYLLRPKYATPETLRQVVASIKSSAGDVQLIGSQLVVTDFASNVRDMLAMAKLVDVPGGSDGVYTIPVLHADATKLADKVGTVLKSDANAALKLLVDERTNTLIVSGSAAGYARVKALVDRLDIALDIEGGTSIHVYQLGSAISDELAKTLNDAIQTAQPKTGTRPTTGTGDAPTLEGQARVISDQPTNKLIVMSSGRDFLAIRDVIRELDVPRRQVYIEATIFEVQVGKGLDIGSSSHGAYKLDDGRSVGVGGVQMPLLRSLDLSTLSAASGLVGGLVGKALTGSQSLLGKSMPSYAILFQALAKDSHTNVLSMPSVLVVDNERAKYKVGQNVPYKKGVMPTSTLTATSDLTTNIDRKDLLLELDIKPHISTDDTIMLELKQSSEDIGEDYQDLGPSWNTRGIETRVLVRDQQTILISGLMQERDERNTAKVPLLGDIPLLGYFFKYTKKSKKKTNMLIMLTPYIIKDQLELEEIRERKQRQLEEFVGSLRALDGMKYQPRIDYRRKRGLVEEINRVVQSEEADTKALKPSKPAVVEPGLVEQATD